MFWPYFFSLVSLLFCFFAFLYLRAYIRRSLSQEESVISARDEVNRIIHRIEEVTERDISLIEDREKTLKALLEEADKRVRIYAKELEKGRNAQKTYQDLGNSLRNSLGSSLDNGLPESRRESGQPVFGPSGEREAARPSAGQMDEKAAPGNMNEQIRNLALAGFSPPLIASRLGIHIAEVELAMALLERKPPL
jgi:hypothetical protein